MQGLAITTEMRYNICELIGITTLGIPTLGILGASAPSHIEKIYFISIDDIKSSRRI